MHLLPRVGLLVLAVGSAAALAVEAQSPRRYEVGVQGLVVLQDPHWIGGGGYAAWRPGGHARLGLTILGGSVQRQFSGRGELLAHLLLSPGRKTGAGIYGLGGIAAEVGPRDQGFLILGLGLEQAPGRGSGWAIEAGVGGGVRISVGWRWRWPAEGRSP